MKSLIRISFLLSISFIITCTAIAGDERPITCKQGNYFIQNVGQLDDPSILYYSDIPAGRICVRQDDIVFQFVEPQNKGNDVIARFSPESRFQSHLPYPENEEPCARKVSNVYVTFSGSDFTEIIPEDEQVTKINIFKGNDPNKWHTDIPTFGAVRIRNLYEDVDLVIGGEMNVPDVPVWRLEGDANNFDKVKMAVDGDVLVDVPIIKAPAELPAATEAMDEQQEQSEGQQLLWATYLGGSDYDIPAMIETDQAGDLIVLGYTFSNDIPVPNGYVQIIGGATDIYVAKMSPEGESLKWGTFIGGSLSDTPSDMAIGLAGDLVLAGQTSSSDIPVPNGIDQSIANYGEKDMYIARLAGDGNVLLWGTYIGGMGEDAATAVKMDPSDNIVVAGTVSSGDVPLLSGYDNSFHGYCDMYLAKISSSGDEILWGTLIGGSSYDYSGELLIEDSASLILSGTTSSSDMPVPGGYDKQFNGGYNDTYIAKLSTSGSSLTWATYLGGKNSDYLISLGSDGQGNIIAGGTTDSDDLPAPNGFDTSFNGEGYYDIYLSKITPSGDALLWGTYIGGSKHDSGSLSVAPDGNITITGWTQSTDIPVPGGYDQVYKGGNDIYAAQLSSSGKTLIWGTYLGGSGGDSGCSSTHDMSGNIIVSATTSSTDIPVSSSFDMTFNGMKDIYVAKLSKISSSPPQVSAVIKMGSPFRLKLSGSKFNSDAQVFIGGDTTPWPTAVYKSENLLLLKGGTSLKNRFPKGVPVEIKVVNGDGGSAIITYTR